MPTADHVLLTARELVLLLAGPLANPEAAQVRHEALRLLEYRRGAAGGVALTGSTS